MPVSKQRHSSTTHQGTFFKRLPVLEGTGLILSGTIGAGILGIPYAISKVGVGLGLLCIILVGALVFGFNLLIAEVACSTKRPLQLVGLARTYFGKPGEIFMTAIMYTMLFGVLLIYIIGEGESLSALLGGDKELWATIFALVAGAFVVLGMKTVKFIEMILMFCVLSVVMLIVGVGIPHIQLSNLSHFGPGNILLLYSVLMFAFHSTTAIPEAHSILPNKNAAFKKSIFASSLICIAVYALFALAVVGVTGAATTPLATIGLGYTIGPAVKILGNLFAIFAMGTGFLMGASALRDSLSWDFHFSHIAAALFVCAVPLLFYFFGVQQFLLVIDIIGGVFVSLEMLFMVMIYWRARKLGHVPSRGRFAHHALFGSSIVFAALLVGTLYNVIKYF